MAPLRHLLSRAPPTKALLSDLRRLSTSSSTAQSHHNSHQGTHQYLPPSEFIGSWKPPKDPKEAKSRLFELRRDYARKVKEIRKEYIHEMEAMAIEKQRKAEARREALRIAKEERRAAKAEENKAKAVEREAADEEFRKTLLKEREEKLEYWRKRESQIKEKKKEKKELLRRQSSMWIDEAELGKKILEAIVDTNPL